MTIYVSLETDWKRLKTHVFKEFETREEAEHWSYENMDMIKSVAVKQRRDLGISEHAKRRISITAHPDSLGLDIAHLYITV